MERSIASSCVACPAEAAVGAKDLGAVVEQHHHDEGALPVFVLRDLERFVGSVASGVPVAGLTDCGTSE